METVALMETEHDHAASVSRGGWAHPQTETLGRQLDDPAAGATYPDRGLYRIVHDHIISRDHDGASLRGSATIQKGDPLGPPLGRA